MRKNDFLAAVRKDVRHLFTEGADMLRNKTTSAGIKPGPPEHFERNKMITEKYKGTFEAVKTLAEKHHFQNCQQIVCDNSGKVAVQQADWLIAGLQKHNERLAKEKRELVEALKNALLSTDEEWWKKVTAEMGK